MPQPKLSGHILGGCYTFPEESKDVPDKWVEIYIHDLLSPGNLLRNHLVSKLYMEDYGSTPSVAPFITPFIWTGFTNLKRNDFHSMKQQPFVGFSGAAGTLTFGIWTNMEGFSLSTTNLLCTCLLGWLLTCFLMFQRNWTCFLSSGLLWNIGSPQGWNRNAIFLNIPPR